MLLVAGANPNTKDNYGETARIWADRMGRKHIIEPLIKAGAK
jgi:ankyrin repeat protein